MPPAQKPHKEQNASPAKAPSRFKSAARPQTPSKKDEVGRASPGRKALSGTAAQGGSQAKSSPAKAPKAKAPSPRRPPTSKPTEEAAPARPTGANAGKGEAPTTSGTTAAQGGSQQAKSTPAKAPKGKAPSPRRPPTSKPTEAESFKKGAGGATSSEGSFKKVVGDAILKADVSAGANKLLLRMLDPRARGLAAASYAIRVNKTFGWNRSPAELLYHEKPEELVVQVDAAHDHSTVSALQLSRNVTLVAVRRPKSNKTNVGTLPSTKVEMGDELVLKGLPYQLAAVAVEKSKKLVLAPRHDRDKITKEIQRERQALICAAETLKKALVPVVRHKMESIRAKRRIHDAARRLQCVRRGQLQRRETKPMLEAHRATQRAAKLRSRRLMAALLAAVHNEPICTKACFEPTAAEDAIESLAAQRAWATSHPGLSLRYTTQAATSKAHTASINRYLGAAPEAKKRKPALPLSPLGVLSTGALEMTATVDKRVNNMTVGQLALPKSVTVVRTTVNKRTVPVKNQSALNAMKLLVGDALVLRGLPHHVAAVCDVKGGALCITPAKERKGGAELKRQRLSMVTSASRLASTLQGLARQKLALRLEHREAHAALVIQIEWATFAAKKRQSELVRFKERSQRALKAAVLVVPSSVSSVALGAASRAAPIVYPVEEVAVAAVDEAVAAEKAAAETAAAEKAEAEKAVVEKAAAEAARGVASDEEDEEDEVPAGAAAFAAAFAMASKEAEKEALRDELARELPPSARPGQVTPRLGGDGGLPARVGPLLGLPTTPTVLRPRCVTPIDMGFKVGMKPTGYETDDESEEEEEYQDEEDEDEEDEEDQEEAEEKSSANLFAELFGRPAKLAPSSPPKLASSPSKLPPVPPPQATSPPVMRTGGFCAAAPTSSWAGAWPEMQP